MRSRCGGGNSRRRHTLVVATLWCRDDMLDGTVHPDYADVAAALIRQIPRDRQAGSAVCVYHRGHCVVDIWGGIRDSAGNPVNVTNLCLVYARSKAHWSPNRIFTDRNRDKRYNQYLINPEANHSDWEFETLSKAFTRIYGKKTLSQLKKEMGSDFDNKLNQFVIENASRVMRTARPDYDGVSKEAKDLIDRSIINKNSVLLLEREGYPPMYIRGGERLLLYKDKLKEIDGEKVAGEPLTTLWDDLLSNNLHNEGGVTLPKSKKPEGLLKRILELSTKPGDIVLDAYLGSGTTAAVAHKMGREYIGIERGEHAVTKCRPRLFGVVDGEDSGISKAVKWKGGGGFRFYRLGDPVFDETGHVSPGIRFPTLAAHLWFAETGRPSPPGEGAYLGVHEGTGYYLLYNGVLGDKRPNGGNVLTSRILRNSRLRWAEGDLRGRMSDGRGTARTRTHHLPAHSLRDKSTVTTWNSNLFNTRPLML